MSSGRTLIGAVCDMFETGPSETIHATTVSFDGQGIILLGKSGAGKSSLALQLISLGAGLVADDRTILHRSDDDLIADSPESIKGMLEARGVGLLRLPAIGPTRLALAVNLDLTEDHRLPYPHHQDLLDVSLPCLHNASSPHFAAAILLYLQGGVIPSP